MIYSRSIPHHNNNFSNTFKIGVRFGHMHELLGEAFFAPIAGLRAIKITKSSSSGSREKQTVIANVLLNTLWLVMPAWPTANIKLNEMKWNTAYHIYEAGALLVIVLSWWLWATDQMVDQEVHWQSFDGVMERSLTKGQVASQKAVKNLKVGVRKNGNSREGLARIERALLLQKRTQKIIAMLDKAKKRLNTMPSGAYRKVSNWLIAQGEAHHIKKKLDQHVNWLNWEHRDLVEPFEKFAKGNPAGNQDFAHYYFEYASPAEASLILSFKQVIIRRYEAQLLKKLGAGDLSSCCVDHRIEAGVWAPTDIIQVGDTYAADLFISSWIHLPYLRMQLNQTPLTVADGQGRVAFQTQGVGRQFWDAKIIWRLTGRDTTVIQRVPLEVLPK